MTVTSRMKGWMPFLAWAIPAAYFFLAFLQMPVGMAKGLDPSWAYAISRAAAEKLIFGKDIIFTCGPFGYLVVAGLALKQHFLSVVGFHAAVHLIFCGLAVAKLIKLKHPLQKMLVASALTVPFLLGISSFEHELICTFLIVLSFDSLWQRKYIRWAAVGLGGIAGFCLLTKFTVGVNTLGSLILLLGANFCSSLKSKSDRLISFLAVTDALLAAISVAFIFLNPNPKISLKEVLLCLVFAGIIGAVTWLMQKRILLPFVAEYREEIANDKGVRLASATPHPLTPSPTRGEGEPDFSDPPLPAWERGQGVRARTLSTYLRRLGWKRGFYVSYCLFLSVTVLYSSPSLADYLKGCLEISEGYSSAMSIVGSNWELGFAVSELILGSILLILLAREGNLGWALVLAFVLALAFKHGFVRQDLHVAGFIRFTPIIVWLCWEKLKTVRFQKLSHFAHGYVLILAFAYLTVNLGVFIPHVQALTPARVGAQLSSLLNLKAFQSRLNKISAADLAQIKLPEQALRLVGKKPIDIVPWEVLLAEANQLNWKPRPVFQSYSAYTRFLDSANYKSLSSAPRDYIFYNFASIDGRHPFFDEPETFFHILCNYEVSPELPEFINMPGLSNLTILSRRKSSICSALPGSKTISIPWNTPQPLEKSDGSIVRAAIKFEYSTFGKLYKTLFRVPPVKLLVTDLNNYSWVARLLPGNSENGVLISHLPQDALEAFSLFQGELPSPVKSFSFSTRNPFLFKPNIEISFVSYNLASVQPPPISLDQISSRLSALKFLPKATANLKGFLDTRNTKNDKPFKKGDTISLSGWATQESGKGEKNLVLLTYGKDNKPVAVTTIGLPRPDVARALKSSAYSNSGWKIDLKAEVMPKGAHNLKAWIYMPASHSAVPLTGVCRVEIR